jgi:uncharacterized protein (TIGR03089 family)
MDDLVVAAPPALITYYDDATGERSSVTAAELGDWSTATAALLVEGCGLSRGDQVAVLLAPHWETAAVLLGAWSAGLEVSYQGWATAGLQKPGSYDATFVAGSRVDSWLEHLPESKHQFVLGDAPVGYRTWRAAVRPYLGARRPGLLPDSHDPASPDGTTFGEWSAIAAAIAQTRDVRRGDRVLIDAAETQQPVMWLLAPLTAGASLVLTANLDPAGRDALIAAERITKAF